MNHEKNSPKNSQNQQAIVLGGSIAGLLAAAVLSRHFAHVTLIERDPIRDEVTPRKGTPQARHGHGLLAKGYQVMTELLPGLRADLQAAGAVFGDIAQDVRFYQGGYSLNYYAGIEVVFVSRPMLETLIRRRVLALPNVTLRAGCAVEGLLTTPDRGQITGVMLHDRQQDQRQTLAADLVVDATGRGSPMPKWLAALGYAAPEESTIEVGVSYATRLYRRAPGDMQTQGLYALPLPPLERRGCSIFPIEGDRWMVAVSGYRGEQAPTDAAGFEAYIRTLPTPEIAQLIKRAEPLSDPVVHTFPSSRRRHYEKLARFPGQLIVMGDAACSFNPVYGQGMTVCALEAQALDQWLQAAAKRQVQPDPRRFFQMIAKVIEVPWMLTAGVDNQRTQPATWVEKYIDWLRQATRRDQTVSLAFLKVAQLLESPVSLFHPKIVWRVLRDAWRNKPSAPAPQPGLQAVTTS